MTAADKKERVYLTALGAMIALYTGIFFTSSAIRFFAFHFHDMDLGVYDQIIWKVLHGQCYSSILRINFLGQHAHFLAFPLAVIYAFFPHPLTLLFIQTFALGAGAIPLYLLARRLLDSRWALLTAALYLLYPGLGGTNAYEFHFTPFATLGLMCACYFFFEEKYRAFSVAMIVTLLCQENLALVVFAFGTYALVLKRTPKWWLPWMVIAVFYFIFCIKFLFPTLNPNRVQFISIYDHFGRNYGEIAKTLVMHPLYTLSYMFTPQKVAWLLKLFFPLLFVSWMAPLHLLPAVPLFLQHLLSNRPEEINLKYHYAAELIPFIFVSFVFGIRQIMKFDLVKQRAWLVMVLVFGASFISMINSGPDLPFGHDLLGSDAVGVKQKMVQMVSPQADVVTTFEFMSHLSHRQHLYSFHHIYTGVYTLSDLSYAMPSNVDEALIDFDDWLTFKTMYGPQNYKNIQVMLGAYHLRPVAARDNIVFFRKNGTGAIELYRLLNEARPSLTQKPPLFVYNGIELKSIETAVNGPVLEMLMTWTAKVPSSKDINFYVDFLNDKGTLVQRTWMAVCYRIFPTQAWGSGQWVLDHKYVTIPSQLRGSPFTFKVGFYDQGARRILGYLR